MSRCMASRYLSDPQLVVEERIEHLDRVLADLRLLCGGRLDELENRLSLLGARLETLSPYAVLKRGYSVALDKAGEVVSGAEELSVGDLLRLRFDRGEAKVRVEDRG